MKNEAWLRAIKKYQRSDLKRGLWQLCNTILPYFALWYLMILSLEVSYWITLALSVLAGGFLVRVFIISHDCGHGSFFSSKKANDILGSITGILTFSPYYSWRYEHKLHHANAGDLDHRGAGDIWTMTVDEYLNASFWMRLQYRAYRNPIVMFGIGPMFTFLVSSRFNRNGATPCERRSVARLNLSLLAMVTVISLTIGPKAFLMIQLPTMFFGGAAGVWMFYVQHQFEGVYWERHDKWDFVKVALEGSSYYKLPNVLQWFSGNIGFHHVHHLSARIPNYFLEKCHRENPFLQQCHIITFFSSLKTLRFRLWDEERRELVGFGVLRTREA